MLLTAALSCRPFKRSLLGTLCLVCSRVRAETHDLCVWLWRASCGAAFRSWHGGHLGWRVLLTAALSCRPHRASLRHVGQRYQGRQHCVWVLCVWLARASEPLICTTCARGSGVRAGAAFRNCAWSLQVASAADRCAELSPFHASLRHVGQRCQGLQQCV